MNHYYNGHDESTNDEIDENDNNGAVIISELRGGGGATSPRSLNSGLSSNVCPFFRAAVIFCDCLGILAIICATHRVYLILIGREKKVTVVEDRFKNFESNLNTIAKLWAVIWFTLLLPATLDK